MTDGALFDPPQRSSHGRTRRSLDSSIRQARAAGQQLSDVEIAAARSAADAVDRLEEKLSDPRSRPFDFDPLGRMLRILAEHLDRLFQRGGEEHDELARLFAAHSDPTQADSVDRSDLPQ